MNYKRYTVLKYSIVDDEIINAIIYYETISPLLGLRFENNIQHALDNLEIHPENYFNLDDNKHRRIIIEGFSYTFIYCIDENQIIMKMLFPLLEDPAKLWVGITK